MSDELYDDNGKGLILSDEHIRQLTEWFGSDRKNWAGQKIILYRKEVRDGITNKLLGHTIGITRPEDPE